MSTKIPEGSEVMDNGGVWLNGQPIGFIARGTFYPVKRASAARKKIQREVVSTVVKRIEMENEQNVPFLFQKERVIHPELGTFNEYSVQRLRQEFDDEGNPLPAIMYRKRDMSQAATIEVNGEVFGFSTGGFKIKGDEAFRAFLGGGQSVADKE